MFTYRCPVDLSELTREVYRAPVQRMTEGSGTARGEGTSDGWIERLSLCRIALPEYPAIYSAIAALQRTTLRRGVTQVMVNVLHAGGKLSPHRDGPPAHYRYHLPIITNGRVSWWDEIEGTKRMLAGTWYGPVPYCGILHSITNLSEFDRVHVIVDFKE